MGIRPEDRGAGGARSDLTQLADAGGVAAGEPSFNTSVTLDRILGSEHCNQLSARDLQTAFLNWTKGNHNELRKEFTLSDEQGIALANELGKRAKPLGVKIKTVDGVVLFDDPQSDEFHWALTDGNFSEHWNEAWKTGGVVPGDEEVRKFVDASLTKDFFKQIFENGEDLNEGISRLKKGEVAGTSTTIGGFLAARLEAFRDQLNNQPNPLGETDQHLFQRVPIVFSDDSNQQTSGNVLLTAWDLFSHGKSGALTLDNRITLNDAKLPGGILPKHEAYFTALKAQYPDMEAILKAQADSSIQRPAGFDKDVGDYVHRVLSAINEDFNAIKDAEVPVKTAKMNFSDFSLREWMDVPNVLTDPKSVEDKALVGKVVKTLTEAGIEINVAEGVQGAQRQVAEASRARGMQSRSDADGAVEPADKTAPPAQQPSASPPPSASPALGGKIVIDKQHNQLLKIARERLMQQDVFATMDSQLVTQLEAALNARNGDSNPVFFENGATTKEVMERWAYVFAIADANNIKTRKAADNLQVGELNAPDQAHLEAALKGMTELLSKGDKITYSAMDSQIDFFVRPGNQDKPLSEIVASRK